MLKQDRFQTETPNVIDPGESPPSRPKLNQEGSHVSGYTNSSSIYTRNGNKGALSKGIPLRFVLDDSNHSDDTFAKEHEIVFEKSEVPFADEDDTGIAQARLFAATMLNESEKRSAMRSTLMHRAPSFRRSNSRTMASARASSFRNLGRASSHRSIPIDSNSNRSATSQDRNIWLVDDEDEISEKLSRENFVTKKLHSSMVVLVVTALVIMAVAMIASSHVSLKNNHSNDGIFMPSDHRLDEMIWYLSETTGISSLEDLKNASSPQAKAVYWLAHEDFEKLEIPSIENRWNANEAVSPFDFVQRYVMLVFYFALGGDGSWTDKYHFASPDRHECSWFKRVLETDNTILETNVYDGQDDPIQASNTSEATHLMNRNEIDENVRYFAMGVACDRDLRVKSIVLPSNNLEGSIPSELQYLNGLHSLNLGNNSVGGSIPEELQNLVHLNGLDLSNNHLTGNVSPLYSWIGETWTHLKLLDLSDNQLALGGENTTHIRRKVGGDTRLAILALGGNAPTNETTMAIPEEIRYFTNLRELYLDNSNLGGRIPAWLFYELPNLQILDLSDNQLTGSISGEFPSNGIDSPLQNLQHLLLHDNPLTGTLPESIGWMSNLTTVTIHHTNMTVGTDAANLICWQDEEASALESLTTDCGDVTCPCCIENCCDGNDCYLDVDWHSGISEQQQAQDNRVGNDN